MLMAIIGTYGMPASRLVLAAKVRKPFSMSKAAQLAAVLLEAAPGAAELSLFLGLAAASPWVRAVLAVTVPVISIGADLQVVQVRSSDGRLSCRRASP